MRDGIELGMFFSVIFTSGFFLLLDAAFRALVDKYNLNKTLGMVGSFILLIGGIYLVIAIIRRWLKREADLKAKYSPSWI